MAIDPEKLREVMAALGKRGGKAKSKRKTLAARRNAQRPRRRLCRSCKAELTVADRETGGCTQCQQPIMKRSVKR